MEVCEEPHKTRSKKWCKLERVKKKSKNQKRIDSNHLIDKVMPKSKWKNKLIQ